MNRVLSDYPAPRDELSHSPRKQGVSMTVHLPGLPATGIPIFRAGARGFLISLVALDLQKAIKMTCCVQG
jgi:hypothetical protein